MIHKSVILMDKVNKRLYEDDKGEEIVKIAKG